MDGGGGFLCLYVLLCVPALNLKFKTIFFCLYSQEKSKHLELFMVEFLEAYRAVKGDLNKVSSFG